jgi:pantetheine-phosphate adenylyltransferase
MPHLAVYAGSFDPITLGHIDVLERCRSIFDEVVLAIGINIDKPPLFTIDERREFARILVERLLKRTPAGARLRVESYTGLTTDFARSLGASAIVRGIRNVTDLAAECQLAITNRQVAGIETVFILTGENFAYVSSSLIKQIAAFGGDLQRIAALVPPEVIAALEAKRRDPKDPLSRLAKESAAD